LVLEPQAILLKASGNTPLCARITVRVHNLTCTCKGGLFKRF